MAAGVLQRVVSAEHLGGHRLRLRFEDGVSGDVDLRNHVRFRGVLAPLEDPAFVAQVRLDPEFGSVIWPGAVDLDPVILYCAVRGVPVPEFGASRPTRTTRTKARRRSQHHVSSKVRRRRRKAG